VTTTAPAAAPLLDEQICFALYSASRAITATYRDLLAPFGLTYPQYLVLLVLWEDGTTSVSGLGRRLQLDSGTLSPLLRRLEATGLVERSRSRADERSVVVALTPAGDALRAEVGSVPDRICAATGLDREAIAQLTSAVTTLASSVRGADDEPGTPAPGTPLAS